MKNILMCLFVGLMIYPVSAQKIVKEKPAFGGIQTIFQTFQHYQKVIIKTDLDSLVGNKLSGTKQPAILLASGVDMPNLKLPVQINARGKYRKVNCNMPPLRLHFSDTSLIEAGCYPKYDHLKLVTHCDEEGLTAANLFKEYWVYKMYNQVTEESFKVHSFSIIYVHTDDPTRKIESHAFIIESTGELAHRLGATIVKSLGTTIATLDATSYHNVLLFNYMIGNTDWMIPMQKNVKVIQKATQEKLTIVPYDFDFTAFVQPPYFRITDGLHKTPSADNRVAMNPYQNWEDFEKTVQHFKSLKKKGFTCFNDCAILNVEQKTALRQYLASFFLFLKKEKRIQAVFGNTDEGAGY